MGKKKKKKVNKGTVDRRKKEGQEVVIYFL